MELQSLIGTLNFACRVFTHGRPFLQHMFELTCKVAKAYHHIKLRRVSSRILLCGNSLFALGMGPGFSSLLHG